MPTTHAILAPSASTRWMTCAPSARLEAQVPGKETAYTREGTIAHGMSECILTIARDAQWKAWQEDFPEKFHLAYDTYSKKTGTKMAPICMELANYVEEAVQEQLDPWEMMQIVSDNYCRFVYEDYLEALNEDPEAALLIEQKLTLTEFIPEGFGSSDAVLIWKDTLQVYDLKYGKGVKVSAEHNTQMMCYALGALCGPGEMYDIDNVKMTIIQPRLHWVSTFDMPSSTLWGWAKEELRPAAVLAFQGGGDFVPGEHCRFCNVAPRCKAFAKKALELNSNRGDTALMTNDELAATLRSVTSLKSWISGLEAYVLEKALEGQTFPGFKVVEGKSNRTIKDQAAAMEVLAKAGFDEASYCRPKELKTISDLEKLLRKDGFQELLGGYVIKPQGKPTLVESNDARPAMNSASSAMEDFKDVN